MEIVESKGFFIKKVNNLIDRFSSFTSGLEFSLNYSQLINDRIQSLIKDIPQDIAISAIGGLGRMELSPYSDIDIVFISNSPEEHKNFISNVIQTLWDDGIGVSHSVRTFSDIFDFAEYDLTSFTQLMEMRFVAGNQYLFNKFIDNIRNVINSELKIKLLESFLSDIEKRHNQFGKSPLHLEPNIKNSKGGIRDLHSSAWIYYTLKNTLPILDKYDTATNYFLLNAINFDKISTPRAKRILDAYDYLIKIRNALHIVNSNSKDRFDFQAQLNVTRFLNSSDTNLDDAHVDLMKKYFDSTLELSLLLEYFVKETLQTIHPCESYKVYELDEDFALCGRFLKFKSRARMNLIQILQAFIYQIDYNALFFNDLDKNIKESLEYLDGTEVTDPEVKGLFKKIFQSPEDFSNVLINMHRLGVLGFLIPEFSALKFYFQPDAYHIYTTDEHTLMAIKNIYSLELDNSTLGHIFRKYENKELLILAILFHDIAKPISKSGHEFIGAQIAENVMQRFSYNTEQIEIVSFLVKNHLLMEQTAFRRNLNDSTILNSFRANFKSIQELDFLYLLTYADLSAVNPSLWTNWKSSLLNELYEKTKEMILRGITAEELLSIKKEFDLSNLSIDEKEYRAHMEKINDTNYVYTFSEEEIALHMKEIKKGNVLSILRKDLNDFTQVTVITQDAKGLLSKICGAISISDCNIHDASIFTRNDGIIIDTFKITDFTTHKPLTDDHYELLAENITRVLLQNYDLEHAFNEHREKWKRIEKKRKSKVDLEIKLEDHPIYSIIDIHTSDRIGLLYLITKKLSELGLYIYFAKIGTKLNGAFDSFYVLDSDYKKISTNKINEIKKALTSALTS